jgi:hypothetical protein
VEYLAAEKIGSETVSYVSNIYKYYIAYRLIVDEMARKQQATTASNQVVPRQRPCAPAAPATAVTCRTLKYAEDIKKPRTGAFSMLYGANASLERF